MLKLQRVSSVPCFVAKSNNAAPLIKHVSLAVRERGNDNDLVPPSVYTCFSPTRTPALCANEAPSAQLPDLAQPSRELLAMEYLLTPQS